MQTRTLLLAALVVALAVLPFLNGLGGSFVYDDNRLIVDNSLLDDWSTLWLGFVAEYYASTADEERLGYYRPVAVALNLVDHQLWGDRALGYKITNLLLHLASTLLLFALGIRLAGRGVGAGAAAIFAVHPIHTESVTFISGRVDCVAAVFYLAGLLCFACWRRRIDSPTWATMHDPRYLGLAAAFLVALLSKEMAVTLPLAVACLAWAAGDDARSVVRQVAPLAALFAVVYLPLRFVAVGQVATEVGFAHAFPFSERLLTAPVIAATYVRDLVAPEFGLNLEPPLEMAAHLLDLRFLGGLAVVATWIGATLWVRRRFGVLAFASAWAFVTLLPVLNLVPIETLLAERFLYIPSAAYALVLAVVLLAPRTPMFAVPARISRVGLGIVILAVAVYLPNAVLRNAFWSDDVTLWTAKLKDDPDSIRAYRNLARYHLRAGNKIPALEALEQIVRLDPGNGLSHYNLGVYQIEEGRLAEARESFEASVAADPDYPPAHYNLGRVLLELGDRERAQAHLREAIRLDPEFEDARWWLERSLS